MGQRWSVEQVEAIAPSLAAVSAARPLATPMRWAGLGADERAVWGAYQGSGSEPYDVAVDHVGVASRCTCPSRRTPCKHAIALLLLWAADQVPPGKATPKVAAWIGSRSNPSSTPAHVRPGAHDAETDVTTSDAPSARGADDGAGDGRPSADSSGDSGDSGDAGENDVDDPIVAEPPTDDERDRARDERVERMMAGLTELDRWLDDRVRTGLADPALARYATWDHLAARLVDAQAGSLANRVRRLAGLVGASPDWHDDVLAELGILHLLSQAGRRLRQLPGALADGVATTVGWQVRQADVLGGVPDTDDWIVAGRSDVREDRIEVRRHWLRATTSGRWALVLSFAAYQQSLDTSLEVGTSLSADLHRYPGPALRALVGTRHSEPVRAAPPAGTVAEACEEIGRMIVAEPWLDRVPATVTAALTRQGDRWVLTDGEGSLPVLAGNPRAPTDPGISMLLAVSGGHPVDLTIEWSPHGVTPLTIHLRGRSIDIGPRADTSFVGAA